jgi:hypothetical protein
MAIGEIIKIYLNSMRGFVRIIPKQGFEEWPSKLGKMGHLYHLTEYEMVKRGYRPAATYHIDYQNLIEEMEKIRKDGLIFTPLRKSGYYEGFAHFHPPVKPGEPFFWYGCLTKNQKNAEIFKKADKEGDHRTIGKMLGYPDCCIDYFIHTFPINYDPIWIDLEGKVEGYPETNQMLRYFGVRITSHLSCSPTCKTTREIGKIWFRVMEEIDKKVAQEIYQILSDPIEWNSYHGVVQVETPYFLGLTHTFPYLEKPRIIHWKGLK